VRLRRALVTLLVLVAGAWYAPAAVASDDTAAVAVNTKDGSSVFRLAFSIKKVAGDVVDNANAAVAYSSCESCRTTALSIQIVLVTGDPETVTPENIAIAINENCTSCETLASAYQWVLGTDEENVRFSPEGRQAINEIRQELRGLGKSDLPVDELQARVHQLMIRLGEVLRTELEPVGKPPENRGQQTESTPTTATTATVPTEPTPTETTEPEPEPPPTTETETTPSP
jgi:putative peptide zinc metalloprotease protein